MNKGDTAYEAGNYYDAKVLYGRAVAVDNTNQEWLKKYHDALLRSTPPTRAEYDKFYQDHLQAIQKMALLNQRDIDHQIEYVRQRDRDIRRTTPSLDGLKRIERLVEESARYIPETEEKLPALYRYRALAVVDRMRPEVVEEDLKSQALRDLRKAVELNPDDHEAVLGLVNFEFGELALHRRNRQLNKAQTSFERGMGKLDEFLAENPDHPGGTLLKLRVTFEEGRRRAVSPLEMTRLVERIRPVFSETLTTFEGADPSDLDVADIQSLARLGRQIGADQHARLLDIVKTAF